MNDYKELVKYLREEADAVQAIEWEIPICTSNHIKQAADVIEQLVKERDAAVADLKSELERERGLNQCRYCKYQEDDNQCPHDCIPYSEKWRWEWRGLQSLLCINRPPCERSICHRSMEQESDENAAD